MADHFQILVTEAGSHVHQNVVVARPQEIECLSDCSRLNPPWHVVPLRGRYEIEAARMMRQEALQTLRVKAVRVFNKFKEVIAISRQAEIQSRVPKIGVEIHNQGLLREGTGEE